MTLDLHDIVVFSLADESGLQSFISTLNSENDVHSTSDGLLGNLGLVVVVGRIDEVPEHR